MSSPKEESVSFTNRLKLKNMFAGASGGAISTLVLHPLDLIKIRFAVNDGTKKHNYTGVANAFKKIIKEEGFRALYKGVTPNCIGAGSSWGLYFFFYDAIKKQEGSTNFLNHLYASAQASAMTLCFTNPIFVVKTRLCLQYSDANYSKLNPDKVYRNTLDGLIKIYKFEGIRGLYKGFTPGLFGVSHGSLQFAAYEELRKFCDRRKDLPFIPKSDNLTYIICAALSKIFAALLTYPYQVVRARLQDQECRYKGSIDVITKTYKSEGIRGFYRGMTAFLVHVVPNIIIVFTVFQLSVGSTERR